MQCKIKLKGLCALISQRQNISSFSVSGLIVGGIGVFPKWSRTFIEFSKFRESDKSVTWARCTDHVSHMCLAGAVVASGSPTQEVVGSSPFTVMTDIFVTEFAHFSANIYEKFHYV